MNANKAAFAIGELVACVDCYGDYQVGIFQGYSSVNKMPYICTHINSYVFQQENRVELREGGLTQCRAIYKIHGAIKNIERPTLVAELEKSEGANNG